jgi:hypothetical protein
MEILSSVFDVRGIVWRKNIKNCMKMWGRNKGTGLDEAIAPPGGENPGNGHFQ